MKKTKRQWYDGLPQPTLEELGYTSESYDEMQMKHKESNFLDKGQDIYNGRLSRWQSNFMIKQEQARLKKVERDAYKSENHWLNTLSREEIVGLVQKIGNDAYDICEDYKECSTQGKLYDYYADMHHRVRLGFEAYPTVKNSKLSRLPDYDPRTKKLSGTPVQFLNLIAIFYPPIHRATKKTSMRKTRG